MFAKVRTGYAYFKKDKSYRPGDVVELTDKEYKERHQIFETVKGEIPKVEATQGPVLENRAILDTKSAAPLIRRGGRKR